MKRTGFTLIEILIVVTIIGVLLGLVIPALTIGPKKARIVETSSLIQRIKAALDKYQSDFGDYPPSSIADIGFATNGINDGIESLLICLATKEKEGPYFEPEEKFLANADNDNVPLSYNLTWYFGDRQAREIVDSWGNPLVYFHHRDYENPKSNLQRYELANKKYASSVHPKKSLKTNTFPAWDSFQIWSFGPDGANNNGEGDDIVSWTWK
jgi:prepilin-type N-terminal cleavage/methylation domain-containing protein